MRPPGPFEIGLILIIILIVVVPVAFILSKSSKKRSREDWLKYQQLSNSRKENEKVSEEQAKEGTKPIKEAKMNIPYIPDSVFDNLPSIVKVELVKMPADRQGLFVDE